MSKGIVYNKPKPIIDKRASGRQLKSGGPRDRQRKQESQEVDNKIKAALKSTKKRANNKQVKEVEEQLEAAKIKIKLMDELVIKKDIEISEIKLQLIEKDNYISTIGDIRSKLDGLASKITSGAMVIEDITRPIINDKIFIDPLEGDKVLDAHIKIESNNDKNKNILSDVSKLKKLLGDK